MCVNAYIHPFYLFCYILFLSVYCFHYRNNSWSWKKPWALGSFDLPVRDIWVELTDKEKNLYYYNIRTMEMGFSKPFGTIVCSRCNLKFCHRLCLQDYKYYCLECFNKRHRTTLPKEDIFWKPIEGGLPDAEKLNLDHIEDEFYTDEEIAKLMDELGWEAEELLMDMEEKKLIDNIRNRTDEDGTSEEEEDDSQDSQGSPVPDKIKNEDSDDDEEEEEEDGGGGGKDSGDKCQACKEYAAKRMCAQCKMAYCIDCYNDQHTSGVMKQHTFHNIKS
jgi:hypothetical protein